jgi:hypothetical protein
MASSTARAVTNLLLAGAAVAVAYYVVKTPSLRRVAWQMAKTGLTTAVPAYLLKEVRDAWVVSGEGSHRAA